MSEHRALTIGGIEIAAGTRQTINLPVADLYIGTPVHLPVIVHRGTRPGPVMFLSAAMHGDEINSVEIVRRVLKLPALQELAGTLLAVPVVNVLAFLHQSRYLPDRRDLNRSFPGSDSGSLAARLANLFLKEVVGKADFGIDLHTGAIHRPNLPQIRADLSNADNKRLAKAFGAPLFLDSKPAEGTLRAYTTAHNIPAILYEACEALRFDETAIRIGVQGVANVMMELEMLPKSGDAPVSTVTPIYAKSEGWARAPVSGILRAQAALGDAVKKGEVLGVIGDPFDEREVPVIAPFGGIIIGRVMLPLVYEGEAAFHIARVETPNEAEKNVDQIEAESAEWGGHAEPRIV
ncbi:MAG: succinylglutamate desuccinylase/aspartoacylase family protein [Pseudomonadota bacterium]